MKSTFCSTEADSLQSLVYELNITIPTVKSLGELFRLLPVDL